jgi:hypothetical protein
MIQEILNFLQSGDALMVLPLLGYLFPYEPGPGIPPNYHSDPYGVYTRNFETPPIIMPGTTGGPGAGAPSSGPNTGPGAYTGTTATPAGGAVPTGTINGTVTGSNWWSNPRLWGGIAGGVSSYMEAQNANEAAARNSGPQNYSNTSTSEPWGPSRDARTMAIEQAMALLQGGGGGRGGGGYRAPAMDWSNSQGLADSMRDYSMASDPLVTQGRNYISGSLNDQYGGSALLGRAFENADTLANPNLDSWLQSAMRSYGPGGGGSGGGSGGGGNVSPGEARARVGNLESFLEELIGGGFMGEQNPHLQGVIDRASEGITRNYQTGLSGLSAMGNAQGAGTSSAYQVADAEAARGFASELSGMEGDIRYQNYNDRWADRMAGAGIGADYNVGMAGVDASRFASANSANASRYATNAQRDIANQQALLSAFGMQNDLIGQGAGLMMNGAGMDVANRQFMLSAIPGYHNIPMDDMERAFGVNFGLDQSRNAANASIASDRAEASRYAANLPWQRLAQYTDIVNGASSGYGTQTEVGVRPGNYQPEASRWGQALAGALGGAQLAGNLYSSYRGGQ